jgi:hypothetical protein
MQSLLMPDAKFVLTRQQVRLSVYLEPQQTS